ncbi:TcmI family type II polyketide cyclase [Streptomyces olivaceiscleroticus]|uniref:TcmI family type II polyketide cyclase n=1 Tax=Streptomyces olivaceiscleroticus TaxID=68245 RepID=UPI0031F7DAEB
MPSIVTVGKTDDATVTEAVKILKEFDESVSPQFPQLLRRQLYTYCGLYVQLQDWDAPDEAAAVARLTGDERLVALDRRLAGVLSPYDPEVENPSGLSLAERFYLWPGERLDDLQQVHAGVIVNRMETSAIPEVSRLFANLDATDFPRKMGTLRRQVFLYQGIYLHIQDFERQDSKEVIGDAWKESDPRFLQIVDDLTPLVPPYDASGGQLATRVYHWAR